MTLQLTQGDLLQADAEAIVNTVNCVGFMGRGIAAQFKRRFPDNFRAYAAACKRSEVEPGRMLVFATGQLTNPRFIINFPTKRHWRGASRIEDIDSGLSALVKEVRDRGLRSIAIPPLGCGLGGLAWREVRPRIERAFAELPEVSVLLYEPVEAGTAVTMSRLGTGIKLTAGRAVLVGLVDRYLAGLMDLSISLLEIHKLLYFAQEAGEPLRLRYKKAPYGPYAENLRHVMSDVEGHLLTGYGDGGDQPDKALELVPGAVDAARAFLAQHPETVTRFERVAKLVESFESPFGMELLASVHWIATHEQVSSPDDIVRAVHEWSPRKRHLFNERQIRIGIEHLSSSGWIRA